MMKPIVKLFLPLLTWTLQKALGPVFTDAAWRAIALSLVPPPNSVVNTIMRERADFDTPALLAPSARRRIRNGYRHYIRHELRGNPYMLAVCEYLLRWRQELEAMGYTADPARIRKLRDIEAETNEYYTSGRAQNDLSNMLGQGDKEHTLEPTNQEQKRLHDATSLAWEFAFYGEGGNRPTIRRNSGVWEIFGLDPKKLESMSDMDGFILFFHRSVALLGSAGQPPDEPRLLHLTEWVVRTHLPHQKGPATTPEAISKAMKAGLIHKRIVTKDKVTGEVQDIDVKDPNAADFVSAVEAGGEEEGREAIIQALARKGIGYSDLTPKEWALIFERADLYSKGYELSSKKGVSISSFYGATAHAKEQTWSRLMKKIHKLAK